MADLNTRLGYDHWFGQNNSSGQGPMAPDGDESGYGQGDYATFNEPSRGPPAFNKGQKPNQNAFGSVSVGQNYY